MVMLKNLTVSLWCLLFEFWRYLKSRSRFKPLQLPFQVTWHQLRCLRLLLQYSDGTTTVTRDEN